MRISAVSILLLSQAATVLGTNAQYYENSHGDGTARREPLSHGLSPKDVASDRGQQAVARQAGAEFVDAALSQLKKSISIIEASKETVVRGFRHRLPIHPQHHTNGTGCCPVEGTAKVGHKWTPLQDNRFAGEGCAAE